MKVGSVFNMEGATLVVDGAEDIRMANVKV